MFCWVWILAGRGLGDKNALLVFSAFLERISKGLFATLDGVNECTEWLCRIVQAHNANGRKVRRTMVVLLLEYNQLKSVIVVPKVCDVGSEMK